MPLFQGTAAAETITPHFVSDTVTRDPAGSRPGSGADELDGGGGNDTLSGGDGADTLDGGTGADTMDGGLGNDVYIVDNVGDVVVDVGGIDTVRSSITYTLSATLERLTLTGTDAIDGTGNTKSNRITGNGVSNVLSGLAGNDTLYGESGDDTLSGGTGADAMDGGLGNDVYIVDNVGDVTIEEVIGGIDTVQSSITYTLSANLERLTLTGTDAIDGTGNGKGNRITGNAGNNVLSGLAGNDTLYGGTGDDTLDGGTGADTMDGGLGRDVYIVDNVGDVVVDVGGTDTVQSSITYTLSATLERLTLTGTDAIDGTGNGKKNKITGNAGNNVLSGLAGDDTLYGKYGNDTLSGGDGNDALYGGSGADKMDGGLGNDLYIVDNVGDVVVDMGGTDTIQVMFNYTLAPNLENLYLTGGGTGTGNALDNVIGGAGDIDNVLSGLAGNDMLFGRDGNDTLSGGDGNDTAYGALGNDHLWGFAGNDRLYGDDIIEYGDQGNDTLNGGDGNDWLYGGGGNDTLYGGAGADTMYGGSGADTMSGGTGNDIYIVDNVGDVTTEEAIGGIDTVQSSVTHTLSANLENLTLVGTRRISGTGNTKSNVITGTGTNNVLSGLAGNDTLSGGGGHDTLDGGSGADTMSGGMGNDIYIVDAVGDVTTEEVVGGIDTVRSSVTHTLSANLERLTLTGTDAIDGTGNTRSNVITGNGTKNVLSGLAGNDTLSGGGGNDTLIGGDGNDVFQFDTPLVADNFVTIVDFTVGADAVALSASIFSQAGPVGPLAANAFFLGATAGDANDRIGYDSATGNLLYDADGNGAQVAVAFGSVTPGLAMTASQFTIV